MSLVSRSELADTNSPKSPKRAPLAVVVLLALFVCLTSCDGSERSDTSSDSLISDLKNGSAQLRRSAAAKLGLRSPAASAAVNALGEALSDEDRDVRRFSAEALGRIGTSASAARFKLATMLSEDPHPFARYHALKSLGEFGPVAADCIPSILAACTGGSIGIGDARRSLVKMGPSAMQAVAKLDSVEFLTEAVRRHRTEEPLDMLASLGQDASSSIDTLAQLLSDPTTTASYQASLARVLGGFGPIAHNAIPALEAAASRGVEEARIALTAVRR